MANLLQPNASDDNEFLEYALVTDPTTATLAGAFAQVLGRLQARRGSVGEEGVALRLAAQMRQAVQWCRSDRAADWNDVWLPPEARMQ